MSQTTRMINLVLRAVALAMGVVTIVLGVLNTAAVQTLVTLLGIGLFALALATFQHGPEPD